ncbi:MAG: SIS domain-containing protein [Streptosporangiaceae bacterium]|nr:SIS domain-containing protein [Streptosporangiaceae bacterium]
MTPGAVMAAEMAEQPGRLAALLSRAGEIAGAVREVLPDPLAGTVLIARGSSDHAATTGRYLLELATGRPVASASPSLYTMYGARTDFTGFLVIGVSQSGRTPEIARSLQAARAAGGRTIAVTNDGESPLAQTADLTVCLDAGPERAVPATKTVTAELAAFALIAEAAGSVGFGPQVRDQLPGHVAAVLDDPGPAREVAGWLAGKNRLVTVARGLLYGAAAEAALKIEETTSLFATGYSAADLRHGPIAVASTQLPVLAFAHPGPAAADMAELAADLRDRGADVRLAGPVGASALPWPAQAPEVAAPVLAVVRAQQLALALARQLGRDPDRPPGLRKVTVT